LAMGMTPVRVDRDKRGEWKRSEAIIGKRQNLGHQTEKGGNVTRNLKIEPEFVPFANRRRRQKTCRSWESDVDTFRLQAIPLCHNPARRLLCDFYITEWMLSVSHFTGHWDAICPPHRPCLSEFLFLPEFWLSHFRCLPSDASWLRESGLSLVPLSFLEQLGISDS
jgi:hypothetical protein